MANTLFRNLTTNQREIVRDVCKLQLSSLRRIYNNVHESDDDIALLLINKGIKREQWEETLEESLDKFKDVLSQPHKFHELDKFDLSVFRHILTNIEEKYNKDFKVDISNLWERLFMIEDFFGNNSITNWN